MDILQASANNFYFGVSLADLKGFHERYPLNSRLVKERGGKLVEAGLSRRHARRQGCRPASTRSSWRRPTNTWRRRVPYAEPGQDEGDPTI